jgi:hypothetical protein
MLAALLLAGLLAAYALTSPATVNGDGLGYLRQTMAQGLAPGHIAYVPLLRALARPFKARAPLDLERPARWLSILCAIGALAFFFDGARRLRGDRAALFATALLGLSYGFFRSAQEVEVYATTALLATVCLWSLLRLLTGPLRRSAPPHPGLRLAPLWAALAGLSCGVAILFHLTLALLVPSLLFLLARLPSPGQRRRCVLIGGVALGLAAGLPFLLALHRLGLLLHPAAAWAWLRTADHGIPYPHTIYTPLVACWGLARSLVYAPYPYEVPLLRVALLSAAGVLAWAVLLVGWSRRRREQPLPAPARTLLLCWTIPLAIFGVLFFPSDTERWIFLLPALALLLAPAAGRVAVGVVAAMALLNLFSIELPQARDDEDPRRAAAVDRITRPTDLVISPGHGWDELIGLRSPAPPQRFIMIYYVGMEQVDGGLRRLRQHIGWTEQRHGRVFVARLHDGDARGFKELGRIGLPRERYDAVFAPYLPRPTDAPGLWELTRLSP